MSTEFHQIEFGRFSTFAVFSGRWGRIAARYLKSALLGMLIAALAVWLIWWAYDSKNVESETAQPAQVAIDAHAPSAPGSAAVASPTEAAPAAGPSVDPAASDAKSATVGEAPPPAVTEAPAVNGLSISSQSWRRGGLGSKALVTFTLRNNNEYAVKDIELDCAFARRDGSHLTDRKRIIPDSVNMKSRKVFAHMLVGFVNVNASRAKCIPIAAARS